MIDKAKFNRARSAILKAKQALSAYDVELHSKLGPYASSINNAKRLKLQASYDRACSRMWTLLEASPRRWDSGVPSTWVCEELSYEMACRSLGDTLSVIPPLAYGSRVALK